MYAQIDPTEADQEGKRHHDPEEVDLQQEPGFEPGEQNPQGEIHHCRQNSVPAGETGTAHPEARQRVWTLPGKELFQQAAEQAPTDGATTTNQSAPYLRWSHK